MRVLITGGAGFVGSNLARLMAERGGYEIFVIDNETLGSRDSLKGLPVRFTQGDIRDKDVLRAVLSKGVDAIVHLAADTRVMDSIQNPDFNFENNVLATYGLLQVARETGVRRILNASTGGAILGEATPPVHEAMAANPISPYGASKLACEGYMSAFAGSFGFKAASLRFSNIYGPGSFHKGSVVAAFLKRILEGKTVTVYGDGTQIRDYLFVTDLADGILTALHSDVTGVYQLGSGKGTSLNELLDIMRATIGGSEIAVEYRDFREGELHATWCDITKARRTFGFKPTTSLERGIDQTWAWFQANASRVAEPI